MNFNYLFKLECRVKHNIIRENGRKARYKLYRNLLSPDEGIIACCCLHRIKSGKYQSFCCWKSPPNTRKNTLVSLFFKPPQSEILTRCYDPISDLLHKESLFLKYENLKLGQKTRYNVLKTVIPECNVFKMGVTCRS